MRSNLLIAIVAFALWSCQDKGNVATEVDGGGHDHDLESRSEIDLELKTMATDRLHVVVYDGCEYIVFKDRAAANSAYGLMSHKGNCSNPIHEHNRKGE